MAIAAPAVMREPGFSDLVAVAPVVAVLVSICLLGPYALVPWAEVP